MLKFDTRDTKPKLYDLLAIAALFAFAVGLLLMKGGNNALPVCLLLIAFLVIAIVRLIVAFYGQVAYNLYSYNTIYYSGFAIFAFMVLLALILLTCRVAREPGIYGTREILHLFLGSAINYSILSGPFILVFSAALCASNISLIRHEGRSLVNVLGILLSFLLVAGDVFLFKYNYYFSGSVREVLVHELFGSLFGAVYLYFESMLIGVIIAGAIAARHEPAPDRDFMIVLGCGLMPDGTPTPLLKGRADRAIEFCRKQKALTGKDLTFITSGGQGPDEAVSESAAIKRYLMEQGVPEDRIVEEDRSTNTFENMQFSKEKIEAIDPAGKVAFATTNYHVFRSGLFARRVKMRAAGVGAPTKWYFWPNAAVREFVGLLTKHRLKQAVILCSLIAIYVLMTFAAYR